ncbi:MAG: LuxR C-terminal-related transcriptional regulator [Chloroflexota bacterium]|nr:LuxR C-terminal-related transcriptional regulator [Chloroflexota bacterium]
MPTVRDQALAPLSRAEAERLLPALGVGKQSLERRILRARCLRYVESFDVAWAELSALHPQTKDPLLAARIAVDLVHLAYYLVRGDEVPRLARQAERQAATEPLMLAELRLGTSVNHTAANEVTHALTDARWAEDALAAAPAGRSRDLVVARVQRQLAHLLSHTGDYVGAASAADATARAAAKLADPWESAWATYTSGFAHWYAGKNDPAVDAFTRAEEGLRVYGTSAWRYTLLCLARARMERGEIATGDRLGRQSGAGAPEDLAHIALLRGEAEVAERILARAPKGYPADEHFRDFARGIVKGKRGDPRGAVRLLDDVAKEFESRGMGHWSLGAAVHAAFNREALVRGGGAARAIQLVRDIAVRGGEGFAYYLPDVAAWLGRAAERDPDAQQLARVLVARGDLAARRAKSDSASAVAASALDEATFYLRAVGLTWREIGVLHEMEKLQTAGARVERAELAKALDLSPETLRVHITRIRAKLDVRERRGDAVLLEAALARRPMA